MRIRSCKRSSAAGLHVTFSPMVDLVRDARWGRVVESTGEDPYLNSRFSEAIVKGFQGDDLKHREKLPPASNTLQATAEQSQEEITTP